MNRSSKLKLLATTLAAAVMLNGAPVLAAVDGTWRATHDAAPAAMHEKGDVHASHGEAPPLSMKEHKPRERHPHRVVVIVYPPMLGSVDVPYFSTPYAPLYVDQDPPSYAYREPNGFYYWCPDPPGYYPDRQDCAVGWRLVAP
jgi:hypothetical protein